MKLFKFVLVLLPFLTACSVYESSGRKTLETQAYQLAGLGLQSNFVACHADTKSAHPVRWLLMQTTNRAHLYVREADTFELKITSVETGPSTACYFQFQSAQELYEKANAAVDFTILHLGSSQP